MRINGKWNIIHRADRCRLRSFKGRGNDRGGNAGVINQAPTGVDSRVAQPGGPQRRVALSALRQALLDRRWSISA